MTNRRTILIGAVVIASTLAVLLYAAATPRIPDTLPREISDEAFWQMVSSFSEPGGSFRFQLMSNEREFASITGELKKVTKPGGVYLGVGPEQNFSYLNAIRPQVAFVFDIRRQNMIEHLIYKAVFEMSPDRATFVSQLFSRKMAPGFNNKGSARTLFQALGAEAPDRQLYRQNLQAIKDRLIKTHRYPLTSEDQADVEMIYRAFFDTGGGFGQFGGQGGFFGGNGSTYASLMDATDDQGQEQSYLASEDSFQFVHEMERRNLIVPLVGDFAGPKAIRAVGKYLKDHDATVTAFYTSNVEQYLFQQDDDWKRYYTNVSTLPADAASTFIRSSHFAYGASLRRQRPGTSYVMLLCSIRDLVKAFEAGRIQSYEQVIQLSH